MGFFNIMILRRLGNKAMIATDIINKFPRHKIYYEPFFGTGSIYFNKPKAEYSFLNDLDHNVFNLFLVVKDNYDDLIRLFSFTPMNEELFYYWKSNEELDPVKKALRFLYLSSFSYLGKGDTFRLLHSDCSYKNKLETLIGLCSREMQNTTIRNKDFRVFFNDIQDDNKHIGKQHRFIYADAPYLETTNNFDTPKWKKSDVVDLFDTLQKTEYKFAYSEFDHPFILNQARSRNLNVIPVVIRKNINNRRKEILITNYENNTTLFC